MRFVLAILLIGGSVLPAADQSWRGAPLETTRLKIQTNDSSPADLAIVGPATTDVGKPITLTITGLPEVKLDQTIGQQVEWVKLLRFDTSAPEGVDVSLEKELVMSVSPWQWKLRVTMFCPKAGVYVLVCDWNEPPYGLALHRVTAGGVTPPDPPVPPVPDPTAASAFILYEAQDLTPDQNLLLLDVRDNRDLSPKLQILDKDAIGESSRSLPKVSAAVEAAAGKQLPVLVLFDADGSVSGVVDLPDTAEAISAKLKEAGL